MLFKAIIIIMLLLVLFSLGSGLVFLVKDQGKGDRVVKSLTWRVGLSMAVFLLLMLAVMMGWIQP